VELYTYFQAAAEAAREAFQFLETWRKGTARRP